MDLYSKNVNEYYTQIQNIKKREIKEIMQQVREFCANSEMYLRSRNFSDLLDYERIALNLDPESRPSISQLLELLIAADTY